MGSGLAPLAVAPLLLDPLAPTFLAPDPAALGVVEGRSARAFPADLGASGAAEGVGLSISEP